MTGRQKFQLLMDVVNGDWNPIKIALLIGVGKKTALRYMSRTEKERLGKAKETAEGVAERQETDRFQ